MNLEPPITVLVLEVDGCLRDSVVQPMFDPPDDQVLCAQQIRVFFTEEKRSSAIG